MPLYGEVRRDLTIVGIGDSHMNGQIPVVASGSDVIGTLGLNSALDRMWNGNGVSGYVAADSQINSLTGGYDDNLSIGTGRGSFLSYIPNLLRMSYPYLRNITIANLGVGGSSAYTWAGTPGYAYCSGVGLPNIGDTFTVDGQTYTFVAAAVNPNEVTIGASVAATLTNLANAINGSGTGYGAGTVQNVNCFVPKPASTFNMRIVHKKTGTIGNTVTLESSTAARFAALAVGGSASTSATFSQGSDTSAIYNNGKSALNGGDGIGNVDVFVITLGSNDALRAGYNAIYFSDEINKLVDHIHTDYPNSKIVIFRTIINGSGTISTHITNNVLPAIDALVAANPSYIASVDINSLGAGSSNTKILSGADGLHATHYGYTVFAQMAARSIGNILELD